MIFDILLVIILLLVLAFFWCGTCNERTFAQRRSLIKFTTTIDNNVEAIKYLNSMTGKYNQHMWCLIFFRDWQKLYNPALIEKYNASKTFIG